MIRAYHAGGVEERQYRAILYGLQTMLGYWKLLGEMDLAERLQRLEQLAAGKMDSESVLRAALAGEN